MLQTTSKWSTDLSTVASGTQPRGVVANMFARLDAGLLQVIESRDRTEPIGEGALRVSTLDLVDLAGSERTG